MKFLALWAFWFLEKIVLRWNLHKQNCSNDSTNAKIPHLHVSGNISIRKPRNEGTRCSWKLKTKNQISIETGSLIRTLQKWVKVFVDIVLSSLISFSQVGVDHQTISLLWSARAAGKKMSYRLWSFYICIICILKIGIICEKMKLRIQTIGIFYGETLQLIHCNQSHTITLNI